MLYMDNWCTDFGLGYGVRCRTSILTWLKLIFLGYINYGKQAALSLALLCSAWIGDDEVLGISWIDDKGTFNHVFHRLRQPWPIHRGLQSFQDLSDRCNVLALLSHSMEVLELGLNTDLYAYMCLWAVAQTSANSNTANRKFIKGICPKQSARVCWSKLGGRMRKDWSNE